MYLAPAALAESYPAVARRLDLPFVLKALSASGGRHNFLVRDQDDFHGYVKGREHAAVNLLAQRFIPNDSTHRLLVLGGEVALAMRRTWAPGTHLTNTAQGGDATLVAPEDLDPAATRLARQAARLVDSEVAGVNLIQSWATGRWYVLDVNTNPAIATGSFVAEKLTAYRSYLCKRLDAAPGRQRSGPTMTWP